MKENVYYMICPNCNGQDCLGADTFKRLVLGITKRHDREGKYLCPYGCDDNMLLFAIAPYDKACQISDKMEKKYGTINK